MVMAEHPGKKIQTVCVGGGTPSTLTPTQLAALCQGIHDILHFDQGSLPLKPTPNDLLTTENCKCYMIMVSTVCRLACNRLMMMYYAESAGYIEQKDVYTAIANARQVGFDNISIDLIFRLPDQSRDDFLTSLQRRWHFGSAALFNVFPNFGNVKRSSII